jgi:hypothetical protein
VLAVDGGSADASVAIAEAAGLLVVRHETRGRAAPQQSARIQILKAVLDKIRPEPVREPLPPR